MSNTKTNMTYHHGIENFLEKFKHAKNFNSKELKLTIQEAEQLSISISLILSRELVLSNRVIELQDFLLNEKNSINDGGKF